MKLGSRDGRLLLVNDGLAYDVENASGGRFDSDVMAGLARIHELREWSEAARLSGGSPVDVSELGPPVPAPRQVFAVALNYRPHAAEAGFTAPDAPLVFTKFPSCITGPEATVTLPAGNVDWEIEIVVVIGSGGRHIAREDAWDAVAGLTLGQDLSERLTQSAGKPAQFSLGKSYAGFGPIGPLCVTPEEFGDRDDIGFLSRIGDEVIQSGRTSELIFPIDDLIVRLSAICELYPGDLIFTGTPAGVGNRRTPQRFLQPGESLVSEADVIGTIRQRFVSGAQA